MQHRDPTAFARSRRRSMTEAERHLWYKLRDRRLGSHKFVRQLPIGPFFADFCCREGKLVIEIDGSHHAENEDDRKRDAFLISQGYRVLRFWNNDVSGDLDNVCETILAPSTAARNLTTDTRQIVPALPSSALSGTFSPKGRRALTSQDESPLRPFGEKVARSAG